MLKKGRFVIFVGLVLWQGSITAHCFIVCFATCRRKQSFVVRGNLQNYYENIMNYATKFLKQHDLKTVNVIIFISTSPHFSFSKSRIPDVSPKRVVLKEFLSRFSDKGRRK